jgi:hypothetical protein
MTYGSVVHTKLSKIKETKEQQDVAYGRNTSWSKTFTDKYEGIDHVCYRPNPSIRSEEKWTTKTGSWWKFMMLFWIVTGPTEEKLRAVHHSNWSFTDHSSRLKGLIHQNHHYEVYINHSHDNNSSPRNGLKLPGRKRYKAHYKMETLKIKA